MPNSHDYTPSILSKNLCDLRGEHVTAIPARSTRWTRESGMPFPLIGT